MERYLEGKTAIVTGGTKGIGIGIVRKLQDRGAKVAAWGSTSTAWDEKKNGPKPALIQQVDVTNLKSVEDGFAATEQAFGRIDILVNNAGINGPAIPCWEYPVEDWHKVIAVDLTGVFYCCRTAIPHMRKNGYGRIINVSSVAGKEGVQMVSGYSAAKAGVIAFTKAAGKELALDGITVNCITPAMVETETLLTSKSPEFIAAGKAKLPMGRFLQIDEIASMVSWIAGPECTFTTGFAFDLTGGRATY
jgi:3-oxoacyl-[acyl-carrier protein] reductase